MKQVPEDLAAHLAGGATTLAHVWLVTRKDGQRLGFTDHDRPLTVDGVVCTPENGLDPSLLSSGPELSIGGGEVRGALSASGLNETDLALGLWDGAEVAVWRVNWAAPEQAMCLRLAHIGEVARAGQAFTAELRSLSHLLDVPKGRVFSAFCDADLGDARCKVATGDPAFTVEATVMDADTAGRLTLSGLTGFASGWFTGGSMEVLSGALTGFRSEVADHQVSGLTGAVEIAPWQAPPGKLQEGDGVKLVAGCDKRFATCSGKFSNTLNFQGFPHMPGNDFVLSYPLRNSGENDGSPLRS